MVHQKNEKNEPNFRSDLTKKEQVAMNRNKHTHQYQFEYN